VIQQPFLIADTALECLLDDGQGRSIEFQILGARVRGLHVLILYKLKAVLSLTE